MSELISRKEALDAIKDVIENKFDNWSLYQPEAEYLIEAITKLRPYGVIIDSTRNNPEPIMTTFI